jgi:hypothetical protein
MSNIEVTMQTFEPIEVTLPDALPPMFTVEFESQLPIEVNFGIPGPQGEQGPPGDVTASSIGMLSDVEITNLQSGDTLVYDNSKFRNTHITNLTDGGHF